MRTLTTNQIGYEAYSLFYILPYKREEEDDNVNLLEKTVTFLYKSEKLLNNVSVSIDRGRIIFSAEYEGNSGYYDYELEFELINYTNESDKKQLMLLGSINQDEHELFEEIIKEKILPKWSEYLGLKSYYT